MEEKKLTEEGFKEEWSSILKRYPNSLTDVAQARAAYDALIALSKRASVSGLRPEKNELFQMNINDRHQMFAAKDSIEGHTDSIHGKAWYDSVFKEFEARKGKGEDR